MRPRVYWDLSAVLGYAFVFISFFGALVCFRRDQRKPLFVWLWFFVPLAPVSQILVPLQNLPTGTCGCP